jgi:hypothetical protein
LSSTKELFFSASAERRMPRFIGVVFRLGTAIGLTPFESVAPPVDHVPGGHEVT